jgi:hypothetical protein
MNYLIICGARIRNDADPWRINSDKLIGRKTKEREFPFFLERGVRETTRLTPSRFEILRAPITGFSKLDTKGHSGRCI